MTRRIQAIDRAVAILKYLQAAGEPLDLNEIASGLGLAKTTTHGLVSTLRDLGLVDQVGRGSQYSVSARTERFGRTGPDPHELRSLSMNWADSLAARTRLAVLLGVRDDDAVRIVHHVFRPDGSRQRLCVDDPRGLVIGLTSYVTKGHLARAVLEATAWQTREVVDAMNTDSGLTLTRLRVDGGMTANHLLMQFLADVLDVPVERPLVPEAVSMGAAYAAGLAVGYWASLHVLRSNWHRAARWDPTMDDERRRTEYANWKRAVDRTYDWTRS